MMQGAEKITNLEMMLLNQWIGQNTPPASLLEQRVLEIESLGLEDFEEMPGIPSSLRQFAIASLQRTIPQYFITTDDELLLFRDALEHRYGLMILSLQEAMLMLRAENEPSN